MGAEAEGEAQPTGRKPGGQPGQRRGHYRQVLPVEEVDEVIEHRPERCGSCGGELEGHGELLDRHQVWELPVRAVTITEHQALACRCKQCGLVSEGAIPPAVRRLVSGERLSAMICYASSRMHGSRRAALEFLTDALGAPLGLGTVTAREKELTAALSEPYRQAKEFIQKAPAKNVDETGWKRAAHFLWVAANKTLAVFHLDPCRNRDAMKQLLGEKVTGTICTDRYGVYETVPLGQRALCWAHLMRDFTELSEQAGTARLGDAAVKLCKAVHELWDRFEAETIDRPTLQKETEKLRRQMKKLLKRGAKSRIKRARSFCKKLLRLERSDVDIRLREGNRADQQSRRTHAPAGGDVAETKLWIALDRRLPVRRTRADGGANAATDRPVGDGLLRASDSRLPARFVPPKIDRGLTPKQPNPPKTRRCNRGD